MIAFALRPRGSPDPSDSQHNDSEAAAATAVLAHQPVWNRDHISYSSISLYRQCSLRFYFKYLAQLPEPTISASFVFGKAIHRAVEFYYRELLAGGEAPSLDLLLQEFQAAWNEHPADTITYPKSESRDSNGHLADRLLRAFLDSDLSGPVGRIIGIEEELRGCLIDGVPDLLARLDLLTESDEAITVTDFKTSRSAWSVISANRAASGRGKPSMAPAMASMRIAARRLGSLHAVARSCSAVRLVSITISLPTSGLPSNRRLQLRSMSHSRWRKGIPRR